MAEIPLGAAFYKMDSLPISSQECVNYYANIPEAPTPSKVQLLRPAGIVEACTAGAFASNRGGIDFLEKPYFVQGNELYRIDRTLNAFGVASYSSVLVSGATPIPGMERVILAENGAAGGQICIVVPELDDQFNAYIYSVDDGLVQISDEDFDGPVSGVQFVDGYFLFTKKNGQRFFISALRDGLSYTSTDFADAEASTDSIVGCLIVNNQPMIFGTATVQTFQNAPNGAGFPFISVPGAIINKGLDSIYAAIQVNDMAVLLGGAEFERPKVLIGNSNGLDTLSTTPIEQEISTYSDETIANCFAWTYTQAGEQFVAFHFPERSCFVYGFKSKLWHTRESINGAGAAIPCRIASIVDAYGVLLVGDMISNKIGILSKDIPTEFDVYIPRRFVTPQIDNEGMPFFINSLELVCDTGMGLTVGQGSNPEVLLSVSKDGGHTFSNPIKRSAGRIGDYAQRVIWNQLGRVAREVCFKFQMSDSINWVIRKVEVNFE